MTGNRTRRDFLLTMGAFATTTACTPSASTGPTAGPGAPRPPDHDEEPPKGPLPGAPHPEDIQLPPGATMPMRKLGGTGVEVSLLGLGGFHIGIPAEQDGIRIVRDAMDHGVTFLDNCWDYNDGNSELTMGKALRDGYRDRAFLMTKLDGRTAEAATKQLEQSLRRLQTDRIDLVQIHETIRMTDPDRVFAPGGAIEALVEAKRQGKLRFIGFTGHKSPAIHKHMLETAAAHHFRFDTVQMPLNVMDPHYDSFQREVLPLLVRDHIGVLGMKPMGSGVFLQSGVVRPVECLHYSMSLPTSVVITGCDSLGVLRQALFAAYTWKPLSSEAMEALLARTKVAGASGQYEQFKTSQRFDGTARKPKWLESAEI